MKELIADLQERTGLEILRVEVGGIDMLRDMAVLKVYYVSPKNMVSNSVDSNLKIKRTEYVDQ